METIISFLFACIILGAVLGLISGWNAPLPGACKGCKRVMGPKWKVCPDCSTPVEQTIPQSSKPGPTSPKYGQAFPLLARTLRRLADRLDPAGAPKQASPYTFTFEQGTGIRLREDGKGCPIWYLGDDDYQRAHIRVGDLPVELG